LAGGFVAWADELGRPADVLDVATELGVGLAAGVRLPTG
jgi:hypothetical protein